MTAGKTTSGIDYRLTPRGSPHLIDELIGGFAGVRDAKAHKTIGAAGCTGVADMIQRFKRKPGVASVQPNRGAPADPD